MLVVVPFGSDGTDGDSAWFTHIHFPYEEGMSKADIQEAGLRALMEYSDEAEAFNNDVNAFAEEYGVDCVGGWVIEEEALKVINSFNGQAGSDSGVYAITYAMKEQVKSSAKFTIV